MTPHALHWDTETRSAAPIKDVGAYRYAADPTTSALCVCYASDDGPLEHFVPGMPVPEVFHEAARDPAWTVYAHNSPFDHAIAEYVLKPQFGWPEIPIERRAARWH